MYFGIDDCFCTIRGNATVEVSGSPTAIDNADSAKPLKNAKKSYLSTSDPVSPPPLVLSTWALDTAISAILKVPSPRLGTISIALIICDELAHQVFLCRSGRITARSKEEIGNLAADKHEKALAGNVISPQDIGVTYNMIGGAHTTAYHIDYTFQSY